MPAQNIGIANMAVVNAIQRFCLYQLCCVLIIHLSSLPAYLKEVDEVPLATSP
jgi:hypothetical protein